MVKLKVHKFSNEKWGRYHQPWINKFTNYLKSDFEVEVVDYNQDSTTFSGRISTIESFKQFNNTPPLSDVDFIFENQSNGEFFVISFAKNITSHAIHYLTSDKCLGILSAHFSRRFIYDHLKRSRLVNKIDKVHPWIFGFFQEFDVDKYRSIRDTAEKLNDKLYFKGGGWKGTNERTYRKVIKILNSKGYLNPNAIRIDHYLEELSKQEIAVSHYMDPDFFNSANEHPGELCYRDIEMMSIGVPYIRIEYKSELHKAFIPNYHYIVIPREIAYITFKEKGIEGVAQLFIDKYTEVKDDKDFLRYISKNQRKWYDENMSWPKSAELVYKLLNIKKWVK